MAWSGFGRRSDPQGRRDVDCLRDLKAIDEAQ
jgi:hypothetical protein